MAEGLTEEESQEIIKQFMDSKSNVHTFLTNIVKTKDTLKVGNLRVDKDVDELGSPRLPVRTHQELALFCNDCGMPWMASHFAGMSEIITASSLSREGFLIKMAVTQKKEVKDSTKPKVENRGLFRKKEENKEDSF